MLLPEFPAHMPIKRTRFVHPFQRNAPIRQAAFFGDQTPDSEAGM
jgi:hypothetical protein